MNNFIAAVYFLLALFGYEGGGTTTITRSNIDGVDVIYSRTRIAAGIARFECIASATGACHYTLFPRRCASSKRNCEDSPIDRLTIPTGGKREVVGLPAFDACVSQDAVATNRDCSRSR